MKTKGMKQQLAALAAAKLREFFAYLMEQGTGKTWTALAEGEQLFELNLIDVILVIAPNGVHTNWTRREIPKHVSVPHIARAWKSGAGKGDMKRLREVLVEGAERKLRILSVSFDVLANKKAMQFIMEFIHGQRVLALLDESGRIKNPKSERTRAAMRLRPHLDYRRILSGTPITNSPIDAFAQFEWLSPGLLGTRSYRAFVAEYAVLLAETHPLVQAIVRANPRAVGVQMIAKDAKGQPMWKNMDKLQALIAKHSYRVLKRDCLDLPPKIYKEITFQITPAQRKAYALMEEECRIEIELDAVEFNADPVELAGTLSVKQQAVLMKLQQITSGFVKLPDGTLKYIEAENGRIEVLKEIVKDLSGKFIVWARFKEELRTIAEALRTMALNVVEYHGEINPADREAAVDAFEEGDADVFVGQAQSGGIGLTLVAAETAIYFSRDFDWGTRAQSEDRNHRIGTTKHVVYIDIIAEDTIDERIVASLRRKKDMAAELLGDNRIENEA